MSSSNRGGRSKKSGVTFSKWGVADADHDIVQNYTLYWFYKLRSAGARPSRSRSTALVGGFATTRERRDPLVLKQQENISEQNLKNI